jgi:hypothetical protein
LAGKLSTSSVGKPVPQKGPASVPMSRVNIRTLDLGTEACTQSCFQILFN